MRGWQFRAVLSSSPMFVALDAPMVFFEKLIIKIEIKSGDRFLVCLNAAIDYFALV